MNKAENNKKLFSSGGVFVDIFIGLLIAACIAGIVYRCFIYNPSAHIKTEGSYTVYFEIVDAQPSYVSYLENGDKVYVDGLQIGTISAKEAVEEQSEAATEADETTKQQALSFLTDAIALHEQDKATQVKLDQGTLTVSDNNHTVMLTPGMELEIYTDTVSVNVRILQIVEHKEH